MIVHHTAIAYGGAGAWEFKSSCFPPFSLPLTAFNGINQSFFMGMFFILSGRFTRQGLSRRRQGNIAFIRSRLLRLALPAVVYTLLAEPALKCMAQLGNAARPDTLRRRKVSTIFWEYWTHLDGIRGPVWYLAVVVIFDVVTVLIDDSSYSKYLAPLQTLSRKRFDILILWAADIVASFAVRLIYPVDWIFKALNLQVAFLPQYVLAYAWGQTSATHQDLFVLAPFSPFGRPLLNLAISIFASVFGLGAVLGVDLLSALSFDEAMASLLGGLNLPALLYAIWNELSFAMIAPALFRVFADHADSPPYLSVPLRIRGTKSRILLARYSYAAFLVHTLVSLGVELLVEAASGCSAGNGHTGVHAAVGPVMMTALVGTINVLLSWIAGWALVEFVPGVGRVV
jgi:glucans biosynthesis protein C